MTAVAERAAAPAILAFVLGQFFQTCHNWRVHAHWRTASRDELIKELERQERELERQQRDNDRLRREHERADRDRDRYRRDRDQLRKKIDVARRPSAS